jgi:hypothetical protein
VLGGNDVSNTEKDKKWSGGLAGLCRPGDGPDSLVMVVLLTATGWSSLPVTTFATQPALARPARTSAVCRSA